MPFFENAKNVYIGKNVVLREVYPVEARRNIDTRPTAQPRPGPSKKADYPLGRTRKIRVSNDVVHVYDSDQHQPKECHQRQPRSQVRLAVEEPRPGGQKNRLIRSASHDPPKRASMDVALVDLTAPDKSAIKTAEVPSERDRRISSIVNDLEGLSFETEQSKGSSRKS